MNRAVVIPWHRYHPHEGQGYRVMFEAWLKRFPTWADEFDVLYIIDSFMEFSEEDIRRIQAIKPQVKIFKKEVEGHHWVQYKHFLPRINEMNMLMLDNDVVITKKGIIDGWFKKVEEEGYDFVGSFDGSGGLQDQIKSNFPWMAEKGYNRMGSYYFVWTHQLLERINYFEFAPDYFEPGVYIKELDYTTQDGDWLDSFGMFTIKMLASGAKIYDIPDPRDTIYLQPNYESDIDLWKINKEPEESNNLGYYHIRNGNLANYVLTSFEFGHDQDYQREINSNKRELLRILAWHWCNMSEAGLTDRRYIDPIMKLLQDLGVDYNTRWRWYIDEFVKYHGLKEVNI